MSETIKQKTLAKPVSCTGVGLHSGREVSMTIMPAPSNCGIKFVRKDLPDSPEISALFKCVTDTTLATVLANEDGAIVSTIEHLLACFAGLQIDNAIVEIDSPEVPIMDGSALFFADLIIKAGIREQKSPKFFFVVKEPIELKSDGKSVGIYPSSSFRITCLIDFAHPAIGKQEYTFDISEDSFFEYIAGARTFGFFKNIEYMKKNGLAKGGSLENAVVIDDEKVINEDGLRYEDEFVRHKVLDCLGDFALIGMPILGHVKTYKSGHAFHHAFLEKFFEKKKAWVTEVGFLAPASTKEVF